MLTTHVLLRQYDGCIPEKTRLTGKRQAGISISLSCMSARKLLEKLGQAALKGSGEDGRFSKAAVSAKAAANLRRRYIQEGR